jgi:hypothetical protein
MPIKIIEKESGQFKNLAVKTAFTLDSKNLTELLVKIPHTTIDKLACNAFCVESDDVKRKHNFVWIRDSETVFPLEITGLEIAFLYPPLLPGIGETTENK